MDEIVEMQTDAQPSAAASSGGAVPMDSAGASSGRADSLPWVEKYRPQALDDLVSHTEIIRTLSKLMDAGNVPNLLFYGPPGTGKTSTMLACARQLYGKSISSMVLELNASDARGINVVRTEIQNFASTRLMFNKGTKLVILDECDAMTNDAQFALRRVIEKYVKNVRFCLICNYVGKIISALQSRCTKFRFGPLTEEQMRGRLQEVIDAEQVQVTEDGVQALLTCAQGDMRKTLNVLQTTSMSHDVVNEENVYLCVGAPLPREIDEIFHSLLNDSFADCYNKIRHMQVEQGFALVDIIREIHMRTVNHQFPNEILSHLFIKLGDVEHRCASATNEMLQLSSLVGAFQQVREKLVQIAG